MSLGVNNLQKSVFETLNTDVDLLSELGANKIFDHQVTKVEFPYMVFANWRVNDWSTDECEGEEHLFEIHVWGQKSGRKQVQSIAIHVKILLHDQPLALDTGQLINLRHQSTFFNTQSRARLQQARLIFRATLEI